MQDILSGIVTDSNLEHQQSTSVPVTLPLEPEVYHKISVTVAFCGDRNEDGIIIPQWNL